MPLGIVSDSEFESELDNSNRNIPSLIITPSDNHGRNKGDNNVPSPLRKIIGETANIDGRSEALELASAFGISSSSVSAYKDSRNGLGSKRDKNLLDHNNKAKLRVSKKAREVLNKAIDNITEDKLVEAKVTDLALVAKSMSGIIKDMEPQLIDPDKNNGPQIVIYAPSIRTEQSFEVINLGE